MNCRICSSLTEETFSSVVLGKYKVAYEYCQDCGFLSARDPCWLDEAYSSAIASTDTGLVMRNERVSRQLAAVLFGLLGERGQGRYADMAGGYGMLVRMMRDKGFDFYWSDKYCNNLMARGFEYQPEVGNCEAVTAIEIMEHLEDPLRFIQDALVQTNSKVFIFTTELFEGEPPLPETWSYYSFETGQHIAFYQRRTLELMAKKLGFAFASAGGLHIFSRKPINAMLLKVCTGRLSGFASFVVRKILGTKVMDDNHSMVRRLSLRRDDGK